MRVAVTGANGRLGRALVQALEEAPFTGLAGPMAWSRREFDLDDPAGVHELLDRDRPEAVVNAAAWTDVDGCAREPRLAMARNREAVHVLAEATAARGIDLVHVSTNEVFDGRRTDGGGYEAGDRTNPINPYGASKLAGEIAASAAYRTARPSLGIVRTAWLFGPPGDDFPAKILAAAERARAAGEPLRVVGDEYGSPTYTHDVAEAIVDLLGSDDVSGIHHVVNAGVASRASWARELFRQAGVDVAIEEVPAATWPRASTPPAWGVLAPTPLPGGEPLRTWQAALAEYLPALRRASAAR
ncbi:MAG TPA: NAD(P)-dependent oxidoreductase [Candidatus Limnocylindrales bacterium]|nr:NAD(P)-dependent oxidoreductase [Candidatus Limnocylindrales bacterium]